MTEIDILELLEIAKETYKKILSNTADQYRFDSGEGSQQMKYKKLEELRAEITKLEGDLKRVRGQGLVSFQTRRY